MSARDRDSEDVTSDGVVTSVDMMCSSAFKEMIGKLEMGRVWNPTELNRSIRQDVVGLR
jgi:hypothetical protein